MILCWVDFGGSLSEQNLRLAVVGAASAALAAVILRQRPRRTVSGWLVGAVASALGLYVTDWLDWPDPASARLIAVILVAGPAGLGFERLRATSPAKPWVPMLVLLSCCGGIWLAVPENKPIVVVAGAIIGLAMCGQMNAPGVGYGLAAAAAWSVLVGARSSGFSFDGGLLCLAPLASIPIVQQLRRRRPLHLRAWPWLVVGSGGVAFAAARWVGVAPDAKWTRVAVISGAAVVVVWLAASGD